MDSNFQLLQRVGDNLASELTQGDLKSEQDLKQRLTDIAHEYPDVFGVGVAFEPYAFSQDRRLFAPYYREGGSQSGLAYEPLEKSYDYTQADWYQKAWKAGSYWMEPLYGRAAGTRIVDYVTPFYAEPDKNEKGDERGIVYVDYSLQRVSQLLGELKIGETGYGFIITNEGTLVSHPDDQFLTQEYSIFDVATTYNSQTLRYIGNEITEEGKQYGSYEYVDPVSGKPSYLFYKQLPTTNWVLCVNFVKDEVVGDTAAVLYRYIIWLIVCAVACGCCVSSWAFAIWRGDPRTLCIWSACISAILVCGIGLLWYMQLYQKPLTSRRGTVISSATGLQRFLQGIPGDWTRISTGIDIQSFMFEDLNTISIIGALWQIFPESVPQAYRDFYFLGGNFDVKLLRRQGAVSNGMLHRWHFNTQIFQDFDYQEFPFDYKYIHVPIVLQERLDNSMLIPDLDAYTIATPGALPGVGDRLRFENWVPVESYFSYKQESSSSNSIVAHNANKKPGYRLYYNLIVRRAFLYHVMSYALPLLVGILAIFFALGNIFPPATVSSPPHIKETLGPLSMFISILFVLVTVHVSMRSTLSGQPIFYLEYFYLLAYALILSTLAVSQSVVFGSKQRIIAYANGIIPKVLYWPSWLAGVFIVTVVLFYS